MHTTLNEILKHKPCGLQSEGKSGFSKLLKFLNKSKPDDEPLSLLTILESNGIKDAIWCLRVLPDYDPKVMGFKLKCVRRAEHLDKSGKVKSCLDVVEAFIAGNATKNDLRNAAAAYADAAVAAAAAAAAAYAVADAAYAVAYADAAAAAAYAAVESEYQTQIFKEIFV